jgi:GH15 family glucan-1,4-alpha-glucosidase
MPFEPIENYGVIGNMQSIGLVGINGSIDFLSYPNFDSPTIFAALMDDQKGGRFEIRPQLRNSRVRQMYLPDTNILVTRFLAEEGVSELTDYMPIDSDGWEPNEIVRKVAVIRGDVRFRMRCQPRFSYATCGHQLALSEKRQPSTRFRATARQCRCTLQSGSRRSPTTSPRDLI